MPFPTVLLPPRNYASDRSELYHGCAKENRCRPQRINYITSTQQPESRGCKGITGQTNGDDMPAK
ncbi:hypothetical protein FB593_11610 [Rhizobium sp. SJZ105]|nr:hypothetical protein FB593_11610 [Rhizobium sp. SJZ105]